MAIQQKAGWRPIIWQTKLAFLRARAARRLKFLIKRTFSGLARKYPRSFRICCKQYSEGLWHAF